MIKEVWSAFQYTQWLSCRVLDSRPRGCWFEPHWRHCLVSSSKNINPSLVLVHPKRTCHFITERLLMGRKESNQTNKNIRSETIWTVIRQLAQERAAMIKLVWNTFQYMQQTSKADNISRTINIGRIRVIRQNSQKVIVVNS